MPLRRGVPVTFTGRGLSDSVDATNSPKGAMRSLVNLLPSQTTRGNWVCRPAQIPLTDFSSSGIPDPGFISGWEVIGDIGYGMIASSLHPGFDQPFAYDLENAAFLPIAGITSTNVPASPPATGDWTPPILCQVASRMLVTHPGFPGGAIKFGWFDVSNFTATVTGNTYEQLPFTGDTVTGQAFIFGLPTGTSPNASHIDWTVTGSGIPANTTIVAITNEVQTFAGDTTIGSAVIASVGDTSGIYVGMTVQGSGIPLQSQVLSIVVNTSVTIDQAATLTATSVSLAAIGRKIEISNAATATADGVSLVFGDTHTITGNPSVFGLQPGLLISGTGVAAGSSVVSTKTVTSQVIATLQAGSNIAYSSVGAAGLSVGMDVAGVGISPATTLLEAGGNLIVLSNPALLSGLSTLFFTGTEIIVTPALTGTHIGVTLTVTGGTETAPLWGAGDTEPNPLPSVPLGVSQMNGRAWFACGTDGIPFSDSLLACVRTNATQALTTNDGLPVTAIGQLMLAAALPGGIVQSLVAFEGDAKMQQILGDPATLNLTMNLLSVATGTHAPNTICSTSDGMYFVSPEGLRFINQQAKVSQPVGQAGDGVSLPFLQVNNPPIPGPAPASRMAASASGRTLRIDVPRLDGTTSSFWYDTARAGWTGPHTGPASLISVWTDTFVITPADGSAQLLRADDIQKPDSTYTENGLPIDCEWEPSLMPDTGQMAMNTIIESSIMVALPPGQSIQIDFRNETAVNLDGVTLAGLAVNPSLSSPWGGPIYTGPDTGVIRQRQIFWTVPLTFKQGTVNVRFVADPGITIGNFYMRYQILGYLQEVPQIPAADGSQAPDDLFWLLANDAVTILRDNGLINLRPNAGPPPAPPPPSSVFLKANDDITVLSRDGSILLTSGSGPSGVPEPPIIDGVVVVPQSAPAGTLRTITITAHDPNGSTLTYTSTVDGVAATPTASPNIFTIAV